MDCHGLTIKAGWLENVENSEDFDIFIYDAFEMQ